MNKLLRKFSFLGDKKITKSPYIVTKLNALQQDFYNYFATIKVGTTIDWAYGKLTRTNDGANYVSSDGQTVSFYRYTNLMWLYNTVPNIKKQWDKTYNLIDMDLKVEEVVLGHNVIKNVDIVSSIYDTPYVDRSCCRNNDLVLQYIQTLELIANELGIQFPDRRAQKLTYLDASSSTGHCINHDTHNGLPPSYLDIQYYTKGDTNYTQRGEGLPITKIWKDNTLDLTVFDVERMSALVLLMAEAFPCLTSYPFGELCMWADIKQAILNIHNKDSQEYKILNKVIKADTIPSYNHDKHMHVHLVGEVSYSMIV